MNMIIASSVDGFTTGEILFVVVVFTAICLLVNRSNSPARYAHQYRDMYGEQEDYRSYHQAAYNDYQRDERTRGGLGMGILIFGFGAVLRYGITATFYGFNLHTFGNILMILGGISILGSIVFNLFGRSHRG